MKNNIIPDDADMKSTPFALFTKDAIKGERTRAGIFAVMGNRDNTGDIVQPGAFAKTMKENRHNIVHLWDHGKTEMTIPTAAIDDLYEIGKSDLPDNVLEFAPEATGAAVVVRTYVKSPIGDHFLAAVDSGAIKQMSFAYAIPKDKSVVMDMQIDGKSVPTRIIREVKQYDTSDVRWGANSATIAQFKSLLELPVVDIKSHLDALETFIESVKAGARNSAADMKSLQQIHDLIKSLHPSACEMKSNDDPQTQEKSEAFRLSLELASRRLRLLDA